MANMTTDNMKIQKRAISLCAGEERGGPVSRVAERAAEKLQLFL